MSNGWASSAGVERDRPLVSIVTATYNRWPLVRETIESALRQSFPSFEYVLVDDGSTDGTADRVSELYPDVRLLRQENRERGAAYNWAVENARGSFIAFLDDDDVFEPWHLAQFAEAHRRHPQAQFFASRAWLWEPTSGHKRLMPRFDTATLARDALVSTVIVPQAMLVARSALLEVGGFPEDRPLMGAEDWLLLIKLSRRFPAVKMSRPSLRVREHAGRSVNNLDAINASRDAATRVILEGPLGAELDARSRRLVAAGTHRFVAGHLYALGRMGPARVRLGQVRRELGPVEGLAWTARLWVQTWLGRSGSAALRRAKHRLLWR